MKCSNLIEIGQAPFRRGPTNDDQVTANSPGLKNTFPPRQNRHPQTVFKPPPPERVPQSALFHRQLELRHVFADFAATAVPVICGAQHPAT